MKKVLTIEGMSCGHCKMHVTNALSELDGVTGVEVSLETKTAVLEAGDDVSDDALRSAVDEAGYTVTDVKAG